MSEFAELSPTEIRLLREHRSQKAMEARPPDTSQTILRLMAVLRHAALAGRAIDPNDPLWKKLLMIVPIVKLACDPED